MIIGIGVDLVKIDRIEKIYTKYPEAFKNKILAPLEQDSLNKLPLHNHAKFLAKRFAAKEAVSKALGTGIGANVSFKDILVLNNNIGKPYIEINELKNYNQYKIDISISDDYPLAVAFAVISI